MADFCVQGVSVVDPPYQNMHSIPQIIETEKLISSDDSISTATWLLESEAVA